MVVDHRYTDAGSIRGCVSSPMYADLLSHVTLPKRLSVLDIGSNVGGFPLLLHALGHEIEKLTCVELNPHTYVRLHFNILSNWPHATVLNRAITSEEGEITITLGQGDTGDSTRGSPGIKGQPTTIRTTQLDQLPQEGRIDILKMDIEHAEVDVLLNPGSAETLARTQVMVIEIHPLEQAQTLHDAIEAAGLKHVAGPSELTGQHIFSR
jgi:FkbM family methyltransferase